MSSTAQEIIMTSSVSQLLNIKENGVSGISYFYNLGGMSYGVSQSNCIFESEVSAILHEVSVIRKHLKNRQAQSTKLFKLLNEVAPQSLQLSLF